MKINEDFTAVRYRIGIDVGLRSIGFAAVEVDDNDFPVQILNTVVFRHDSGIDPGQEKDAVTRLAASGVARRTRRRKKHRARQLRDFDAYLEGLGFPIIDNGEFEDPRAPWRIRALLVEKKIEDPKYLKEALSTALRHIAHHRGWRSPYSRVQSLLLPAEPSTKLQALNDRVSEKIYRPCPADSTPAQIIRDYLDVYEHGKVRGPEGILGGALFQSDYAQEIQRIGQTQGLDSDFVRDVICKIFDAKSPKGSAIGRVGKDALPGQNGLRAEKAHPAFQLFRMVTIISNLRIDQNGVKRPLTTDEREIVLDFLLGVGRGDLPTWQEVADQLQIERHELRGVSAPGPDGMPPATKPPVDMTDRSIMLSSHKKLIAWWQEADDEHRIAMVNALSNVGSVESATEADDDVDDFISSLSDTELEDLEKIELPGGRAAYSVDSLNRLTHVMLRDGVELHEARKSEFGLDDSWTPPAEKIGAPVGNPAVDRVLKQVARWLSGVEARWGAPVSINIEHVRGAFGSEKAAREYDMEIRRRQRRNEKFKELMRTEQGLSGSISRSDMTRYMALQRQRCQCLYCGDVITFETCEMDHIVSRRGHGSTNTRENLAAVCRPCNHSKSNQVFALWAQTTSRPVSLDEAISRVRGFLKDPAQTAKDASKFQKSVIARLKSTRPDDEFDGRSMESVAWMAVELRHRIDQHFKHQGDNVAVNVYRGALTAEARKASGFEGRVNLIGGQGKTRLDRRHHVMDALTIAMLSPSVAHSLALRMNLRDSQRAVSAAEKWKSFTGATPGAHDAWQHWEEGMRALSEQFNLLLSEDRIPVMQNQRLRLGSSAAHKDTIKPFLSADCYRVGDAIPASVIDRASSPQLWTALTRHPDYDAAEGLAENPHRQIRVKNQYLSAEDTISFFPSSAGALAVNGGYVELGGSFHHARLYRLGGKKPSYAMLRVYQVDLQRFAHDDLFTVEIPLSSISVRTCDPKLRQALTEGTAEYLGWFVVGDELQVDLSSFKSGQIAEFAEEFPHQTRWEISGFYTSQRLRLRPILLAAEGLPENCTESVQKIVDSPGWRPSINVAFGQAHAKVVRRSALGTPRIHPWSSLPVSFSVES